MTTGNKDKVRNSVRLKPLILSIDDDSMFRKSIEIVLRRLGLNVKSVEKSDQFIEAAKNLEPDLYLIDLNLGDFDGFELIKTIRKGDIPKAPIVVVSGSNNSTSVTHALELGADDFIIKPLDRSLLATKLSQYLESEAIMENRATAQRISSSRASAKIEFDGTIEEVDEMGIKFSTRTLVPKGTVLKVCSDLFNKIDSKEKEHLVTVTMNWLNPNTGQYGGYAEFDGTNPEFLQAVRQWLSQA